MRQTKAGEYWMHSCEQKKLVYPGAGRCANSGEGHTPGVGGGGGGMVFNGAEKLWQVF